MIHHRRVREISDAAHAIFRYGGEFLTDVERRRLENWCVLRDEFMKERDRIRALRTYEDRLRLRDAHYIDPVDRKLEKNTAMIDRLRCRVNERQRKCINQWLVRNSYTDGSWYGVDITDEYMDALEGTERFGLSPPWVRICRKMNDAFMKHIPDDVDMEDVVEVPHYYTDLHGVILMRGDSAFTMRMKLGRTVKPVPADPNEFR